MSTSVLPPTAAARPAHAAEKQQEWFLEGSIDAVRGLSRTSICKHQFSIGRGAGSDFVLPSRNVSKQHAEITQAGHVLAIRDLNSTNGTFVNGHRISHATPIGAGDLLQFADMEFRLGRADVHSADNTNVSLRPDDGWLISRLHEIVNERKFTMHFQPIVSCPGYETMAYEALLRCQVEGFESPVRVFEAATRMGLDERLSGLCREEAVRLLAGHPSTGRLFVNTHPNEYLGAELVESLAALRDLAGKRQLVLEIHEAAVPDLGTMREFRAALADLGVQLAYDDFGHGQSRLVELSKAPPDYLKFDRGLVKDLADPSCGHHALVQALLHVAHDNGIATIAEGLDEMATADVCREMGFTHIQGFCFSRPVPASDL